MKVLQVFIPALLLLIAGQTFSQDTLRLSLKEAKQYALENNRDVKNAELEILKAKKEVWETTASGLPQVDADISYQNIFEVPTAQFPQNAIVKDPPMDQIFGQPIETSTGTYGLTMKEGRPIKLSTKESTTINLTVSQLIFSGSYIVGLQAAKVYKQLTVDQQEKTEIDTKAQVSDTYYMILVLEENLNILNNTLDNLKNTQHEISEMLKEGFVEDTDLDQIKLNRMNVENAIGNLEKQIATSYDLLKLQIGLERENKVVLTEKLKTLKQDIPLNDLMNEQFNVENHITYQMLETQEKLSELDLKRRKSEFLPTISGFYRHQEKAPRPDFDMTIPDMIGINVQIPIFHSAARFAKVKQAKLELAKTRNQKSQAVQGLHLEVKQAKNEFSNAVNNYNNQKKNMNLAQKIYDKTLTKYKEGMASSMDLTQANNQLLDTQSKYHEALLKMLQKKVQLNKKLNNL
ncbi:MAG: TolC family protein [Bacteroidales bacterium]|nr:TolC family protein [Bacteroidales bacterium]MCF8333098.1 TolC family protein [Bacteroidales bacterium]